MPTKNANNANFDLYLVDDSGNPHKVCDVKEISFDPVEGSNDNFVVTIREPEEVTVTGHVNWWNRWKIKRMFRKVFGRKTLREARKAAKEHSGEVKDEID